jgi:hypothetical protein
MIKNIEIFDLIMLGIFVSSPFLIGAVFILDWLWKEQPDKKLAARITLLTPFWLFIYPVFFLSYYLVKKMQFLLQTAFPNESKTKDTEESTWR